MTLSDLEQKIDSFWGRNMSSVRQSFLVLSLIMLFLSGICYAEINADLNQAILANDLAKVKELISSGADVNARGNAWFTPLMTAITRGDTEIAVLLIENGADANALFEDARTPFPESRTPLMFAAQKGNTEIARLLILKGADINALSYQGATALSIAEAAGNNDMAALLKQWGAIPTLAFTPDEPIFQLHPPATEDELTMYKRLRSTTPAEIAPFIAMRKYFRQLKAQFPDGKVDWKQMSRPPAGIKPDYALDFSEQLTYRQMLLAFGLNAN